MLLRGDWLEKTLSLFVLLGIGFILFLIAWGCVYLIDTVGRVPMVVNAKGINRKYTRAHSTIQAYPPMTIRHAASWRVYFLTEEGTTLSCRVNQGFYDKFTKGVELEAVVISGRISGGAYCKNIVYKN